MLLPEQIKERLLATGLAEGDALKIMHDVYTLVLARLLSEFTQTFSKEEQSQLERLSKEELLELLSANAVSGISFFEKQEVRDRTEKLVQKMWEDYFKTVLNQTL